MLHISWSALFYVRYLHLDSPITFYYEKSRYWSYLNFHNCCPLHIWPIQYTNNISPIFCKTWTHSFQATISLTSKWEYWVQIPEWKSRTLLSSLSHADVNLKREWQSCRYSTCHSTDGYARQTATLDGLLHWARLHSTDGYTRQTATLGRLHSTDGYTRQTATLDRRLHSTDGYRWLRSTVGYARQTATLNRQLHLTDGYTRQTATLDRRLHSTDGYTWQTATLDRRPHSTDSYTWQTATLDRRLHWADYTQQTATLDRRLCSTDGYTGQTTLNRRLRSTDGYTRQTATLERRLHVRRRESSLQGTTFQRCGGSKLNMNNIYT